MFELDVRLFFSLDHKIAFMSDHTWVYDATEAEDHCDKSSGGRSLGPRRAGGRVSRAGREGDPTS